VAFGVSNSSEQHYAVATKSKTSPEYVVLGRLFLLLFIRLSVLLLLLLLLFVVVVVAVAVQTVLSAPDSILTVLSW